MRMGENGEGMGEGINVFGSERKWAERVVRKVKVG